MFHKGLLTFQGYAFSDGWREGFFDVCGLPVLYSLSDKDTDATDLSRRASRGPGEQFRRLKEGTKSGGRNRRRQGGCKVHRKESGEDRPGIQ